jgi:hypothetical protein
MLLPTFLNILSSCIGLMSAMFFAVGAITMHPQKIFSVAATYWDANQLWGDSIAEQRADYISGALLLLVSFALQLAATLVPAGTAPPLLQPVGYAIAGIVAVLAALLALAVLLRNFVAKSTKEKVHRLIAADLAEQEQASKNRLASRQP